MDTDLVLQRVEERLPHFSFIFEHYEMMYAERRTEFWLGERMARLCRFMDLVHRSWLQMECVRMEQPVFVPDIRLEKLHDELTRLAQALGDFLVNLDELTSAMLERRVATTH